MRSHHFRHPPVHRLPAWQRIALYASGGVLLISGLLWLAVHYSVGAGSGSDGLPHPLEVWCLRLHGLAAFVATFLMGALAAAHIPQGWRIGHQRRWAGQRKTGSVLCVLAALLVLSGYALYYFAPETLRPTLGWAHALVGVACGVLIARHRRASA